MSMGFRKIGADKPQKMWYNDNSREKKGRRRRMDRKLYRSMSDKKLCGVCSGVAKFLGLDPTVVRLIWALAVLFAGCGVLLYIVCALIIPQEPVI